MSKPDPAEQREAQLSLEWLKNGSDMGFEEWKEYIGYEGRKEQTQNEFGRGEEV